MADIWVDVDTAVIVPVNILPLLDDTDFKTIETAVVYNSAGLAVTWNFVTTAGVVTGTAVTPTTGGVYDWSEPVADKGMYAIEIPASGGVSINNDTEGFGWFTGVATGVLPWRGPVIGFRAAALNNSLVDGATVDVNVTAMAAGTVTATAVATGAIDADAIADNAIDAATFAADVDAEVAAYIWNAATASYGTAGTYGALIETGNVGGGAIVAASVTGAVGSVGAGGIAAATFAAGAIDAAALAADAGAEIADAVWDEATAGHVGAGSTGAALLDLPTNAELATALAVADDAVLAAIAALNNLSAAQVNAEVVDALATDTYAEPGQGAPSATTTLALKIAYMYKFARNKVTQTATELSVYDDAGTTVDQKSTVSDDATTYTRGEIGTGP